MNRFWYIVETVFCTLYMAAAMHLTMITLPIYFDSYMNANIPTPEEIEKNGCAVADMWWANTIWVEQVMMGKK